jgi:predicted dehydrogenase
VNNSTNSGLSRRDLIKTTGQIAVASALAGVVIPQVHAGENNTIQVALVGSGDRGTGAAENALSVKGGPIKLVAMADVFDHRIKKSYKYLKPRFERQVEVPDKRKYIGFDAYQKAMDHLKAGDVVILTTPPAFRWVHFTYAIKKGLNVFMEKPIAVDGPSTARMLKLEEESKKKNLKVGVGLMCRHCAARRELFDRIKSGQMGELLLLRAYRQAGPTATAFTLPNPGKVSDLLYQIQRFHAFLWASGGAFSDFLIHNIDECCWMKDAWPVEAKASGGRHYRGTFIDQNFDTYSVEYTFADGTKLFLEGRTMDGCHQEFASYAHGTKGAAVISHSGHTPAHCRIFKGQKITKSNKDKNIVWKYPDREPNPYQLEWDHLIEAIRKDKAYNEVKRGAEASLVTAMGRKAAHTGQVIKLEDMRKDDHEFAPDVDKLTLDSPPPLRPDSHGKYPVPKPGIEKDQEY